MSDFDNALNKAKKVSTDAGTVEKMSVSDAIAYDKYKRQLKQTDDQAGTKNAFSGLRISKISPDGTL